MGRVAQLEAANTALEHEVKLLRQLLERTIEHRQKSHSELIMLLTGLVSKLSLNDVGVIVSKLMEHNTNVGSYLAALVKGVADAPLPQPAVLQTLEQTRKHLHDAIKPLIADLLKLEAPFEPSQLRSLETQPDEFFKPQFVRANRCFVKGLIPRERILREFGPEGVVFFQDMTTDAKLNPRPKPEEIMLAFRSDFEPLLKDNSAVLRGKRDEMAALYQKVQQSRGNGETARRQRSAFNRLSFIIELLHYYENQNTEAADVIFAQRLPALIEQLVLVSGNDALDEKLIGQAEELLAHVINPDHRLMVINNLGKAGEAGKTLKFLLRLRAEKPAEPEQIAVEFARHLVAVYGPKPTPDALLTVLKLLKPDMQKILLRAIMHSDRLRRPEAEALAHNTAEKLGIIGLTDPVKDLIQISPELDRQMAWARIRDLLARRTDPSSVAVAIRERLNAKYDADEIRESWITLTETDPLSFIRIFSQLPYLPNGKTDPIARPVMETYLTRLLHEKYAVTYQKVANSLKHMHKAKPDAPTLVNFLALVRWVSPEAADRLCADIGMAVPAH